MPLVFNLGFWEIVIIALIVLLIFGGKKIPELMKGLGKGVKNFKEGMKEVEDDVKDIKKDIDTTLESCIEITPDMLKTSLFRRFMTSLTRIFAPLL